MTDSPAAGPKQGVERLATSTCWELLQGAELCRLAVVNADGAPDIFPVNYAAHEGALYIRTARDAKLMHIAHHPLVAAEVDGRTDDQYWSVVVRGRAERVTQESELRESGIHDLVSWSPTAKFFVIRVKADTVTGRRFPADAGHGGPLIPFEGDARLPAPPEPERHVRAERPESIPHFAPRADDDSAGASG